MFFSISIVNVMGREKKKSRTAEIEKPVSESKHKISATRVSGSPESVGGSREGNIGHESNADGGRGDRQV